MTLTGRHDCACYQPGAIMLDDIIGLEVTGSIFENNLMTRTERDDWALEVTMLYNSSLDPLELLSVITLEHRRCAFTY